MNPSPARQPKPFVPLTSDSLHELASPANQIGSMVDLILRRHRDCLDEDAVTLFEFIQTASRRLQAQVDGLREYLRVAGHFEPLREFAADEVLAGAIAELRPALEQNHVRLTCDPLPVLYGDPGLIAQLFVILIGNAIKFRGSDNPQIHIGVRAADCPPVIWVRDNGSGIDPGNHDRIFSVFRRSGGKFPGNGIGLAIAEQILKQHNGKIWVESRPGEGATFFFTIPRPPDKVDDQDRAGD